MKDNSQIEEMAREMRRSLLREQEELAERSAHLGNALKLREMMNELQAENRRLQEQCDTQQRQLDEANQRLTNAEKKLDGEKLLRQEAEMRLKEMSQMSANMVKKGEIAVTVKALTIFLNKSKNKRIEKRAAIKEMMLELFSTNNMPIPDELADLLQYFDDEVERTEPDQVTVNGDLVLTKHVDNVVEHVDAGANGIVVNNDKQAV